jgi:hypothetical protein
MACSDANGIKSHSTRGFDERRGPKPNGRSPAAPKAAIGLFGLCSANVLK